MECYLLVLTGMANKSATFVEFDCYSYSTIKVWDKRSFHRPWHIFEAPKKLGKLLKCFNKCDWHFTEYLLGISFVFQGMKYISATLLVLCTMYICYRDHINDIGHAPHSVVCLL